MKKSLICLAAVLLLTACQTGVGEEKELLSGYTLSEIGYPVGNLSAILGEDAPWAEVNDCNNCTDLYTDYTTDSSYFSLYSLAFEGGATSISYTYSVEMPVTNHLGETPTTEPGIVMAKNPVMLLQAYRKEEIEQGGIIQIRSNQQDGRTEERTLTISRNNLYDYSVAEVDGYILYDWLDFYVGSFSGFIVDNQLAQQNSDECRSYEFDYNPYLKKVPQIRQTLKDFFSDLLTENPA